MRFAGKFLLVNLEIQSMRRPLFGYSREIATSMCCLIKIHLLGFKTLLKGVRGEQGSVETSGLVLGADSHPLLHTGRMFQERDLALDLGCCKLPEQMKLPRWAAGCSTMRILTKP